MLLIRVCALLVALFLCLGFSAAWAEGGVNVEIIKIDGESEEEAFVGIAAEKVTVAENVVAIEGRAFADCPKLREIIIPASVLTVDDTALEGCADVTVYGVTGSEAQRFAEANSFRFVDPDTPTNEPDGSIKLPPVELPFVPKK